MRIVADIDIHPSVEPLIARATTLGYVPTVSSSEHGLQLSYTVFNPGVGKRVIWLRGETIGAYDPVTGKGGPMSVDGAVAILDASIVKRA